jgi:hypothetical protein
MADTPYRLRPPHEDDVRHDGEEFDPSIEPRKALAWINLLEESERAFEPWNSHCDNVDRLYASMEMLSDEYRAKRFSLFWANCEVLKPSIYAKPPVPVVTPRFKDRRPVYQAASEVLERCASVSFDLAYIDDVMMQIRDDIAMIGRGVAWCRYESGKGNGYYDHERVCVDYKHRRDFLHSVSRCWYEVTWVAAASYLTRSEARERFYRHSGDAYQEAEYQVDRDSAEVGGADDRERAKFWEIWHRGERRVVWVAKGCEFILDEDDPHLELQGFFPCPKPAYGTCQRGSLVPVPDVMQYKDQLDEVDLLTGRIHALSDALEMKGFYPSGTPELADAIQTAVAIKTPGAVMVPISNWASFGGSKEIVVWMPIEQVAACITAVVALRKEVISDIYQIMGLSDIMRGATDARETLGAQELKTQYGGSRIRDKQYELVRLARDVCAISAEIICQKFADVTIVRMSQTDLKTAQMQREEAQAIQQQLMGQRQAMIGQMRQQGGPGPAGQPQDPQAAQQLMQQAAQVLQASQDQISRIYEQPTLEQVLTFLRDNRTRTFVLDIETDSTIVADEQAEKASRNEYVGQLSKVLPQFAQFIAADPSPATVQFCGDVLKFSTSAYRAGRSLEGSIDDLVEAQKERTAGPRPDDPTTATNRTALQIEQIKQQRQKAKDDADTALKAQELQMKDQHVKLEIASRQQIELAKLQSKQGDDAARAQMANQKAIHDREKHQADMVAKQADMAADARKMAMAEATAQAKRADMAARQGERQAAQQFKQASQSPFGT